MCSLPLIGLVFRERSTLALTSTTAVHMAAWQQAANDTRILVKTLPSLASSSWWSSSLTLMVPANTSILRLKQIIQERLNIPKNRQHRLFFGGNKLKDFHETDFWPGARYARFSDHNIPEGSTLWLLGVEDG